MKSVFGAHHNKLRIVLIDRRTAAAHEIGWKEGRVAGGGSDAAALRPVSTRPFQSGLNPSQGTGVVTEAIRDHRQTEARRNGLALTISSEICGFKRSMTWARSGLPASGSRHLSPPPIRLDLPPANTMPMIVSGPFILGI